eukprot:c19266_g1_i1 orf=510-1043(+)
MAASMDSGLRRLHTFPAMSKKRHLVEGLTETNISITTEFADLNGLNLHYTSLRDLITPTQSKRSPRNGAADWLDLSHITFKNQLLKQAARAYLQPMVVESHQEKHFLARCWVELINGKPFLASVKDSVYQPVKGYITLFAKHVYSKLSRVFEVAVERLRPQLLGFIRVKSSGPSKSV